jgi:pre-mRNA-splicing factor SYF2
MLLSLDRKGKFSRRRLNEDEGDITYINEHNKVFNKKVRSSVVSIAQMLTFRKLSQIARYYDKYTKEIRDSFERGTAL